MADLVTLRGIYKYTLFRKDDFFVVQYTNADTKELFTACGQGLPLVPNVKYLFVGVYKPYKNGEMTLNVESYEIAEMTTEAAIVEYLASVPFTMGRRLAKKFYKLYGSNTIYAIKEAIAMESDTIYKQIFKGTKKADEKYQDFVREWHDTEQMYKVTHFLVKCGLSRKKVYQLNQKCKDQMKKTIDVLLKENPYAPMNMKAGVNLQTCDLIARGLKFPNNSKERILAGIKHCLQEAMLSGHMFLYDRTIDGEMGVIEKAAKLLSVSTELVCNALRERTTGIRIEKNKSFDAYRVYLDSMYYYEDNLAKQISEIAAKTPEFLGFDDVFRVVIKEYEKKEDIDLADNQIKAVMTVMKNNFTVITGGAGTGKTTVLKALIYTFKHCVDDISDEGICLLSPTGKAARRITESTSYDASTIHSRIQCGEESEDGFAQEIDADLIVIDETSMLDCRLANLMFSAISRYKRIVFVGDIEQLPSVGPGSVLKDLIVSGAVPVVTLDVVQRQAKDNKIVENSIKILAGKKDLVENEGEFFIKKVATSEQAAQYITNRYIELCKQKDVQILIPMKKSTSGSHAVNAMIQNALIPSVSTNKFRVGDRVINLKNNKDKDISNGDIGVVKSVEENIVEVFFETGITFVYDNSNIDNLTLAYSITVHKSQGSEFEYVIIAILDDFDKMLYRNLLYTAVTRGKKYVEIVATNDAIEKCIDMAKVIKRNTTLAARIKYYYQKNLQESKVCANM